MKTRAAVAHRAGEPLVIEEVELDGPKQGARMAGAGMIVGIDLNPAREALGRAFGMTHFVNPKDVKGDLVPHIVELTAAGPTTASSASAASSSCARRSSAATAAGA